MNVATLRLNSPNEDIKEWSDLFDLLAVLEGTVNVGQGPQGPEGPQGVQGPIGPQGTQGPMGTSFVWEGTWSGMTTYVVNDAVERSGETYIAIQDGTNHDPAIGQPNNAFWDVLAVAGVQGPTGETGPQGVPGATGATGATGVTGQLFDYIQDTDPTLNVPNTVVALKTWGSLATGTAAIRNGANTAWVFFSNVGGAGSGYGVGPFGTVPWDTTIVTASAYTTLSNGVIVPNYATVGWGKLLNEAFFTELNDLMDRVTVLEE